MTVTTAEGEQYTGQPDTDQQGVTKMTNQANTPHLLLDPVKLIDAAWAAADAKWARSKWHRRVHFEGGEGYDPYEAEAERLSRVASDLEYALLGETK